MLEQEVPLMARIARGLKGGGSDVSNAQNLACVLECTLNVQNC